MANCCGPEMITVGGVSIAVNSFDRARNLLSNISSDMGDPVYDEYEGNIAGGNNTTGTNGAGQFPPPTQTTPPKTPPTTPNATDDKPPPGKPGVPVSCMAWSGSYDDRLSPNFKVRDFTINAYFPNQLIALPQYPIATRLCNLQNLSMNVAEPLFAKFGRPRINSGLRNENSVASGVSQHVLGEAADFQWADWTYLRYWEAASWVKDNIPYDQFIFEHSSTTKLAWFHLSYKKTGNRPASSPTKVMTMYNNQYISGLKKYY